jgi:predicted amidohydrolase
MNFRAALAQIDCKVGNLQANVDHHLELVDEAVKAGAQLVMFPELSLTGYSVRDLAWNLALNPFTDPLFEALKERSRSISILLGFVESGPDHGIYNSALVLEDGEVAHVHRKIYPPTYGMFEEGRYFSPGKRVEAFDSKLGRFGVLICEDLWHLSLPYLLAHDGAEAIFTLTASPSRIAGGSADLQNALVNHEQHRVYARLLSSYILFCNRVGFEDGVNFWGGSAVTSPSGETTVTGKYFAEDLVFGQVDSHEVQRARRLSRHFLDENLDLVTRNLARITDAKLMTSAHSPLRRR